MRYVKLLLLSLAASGMMAVHTAASGAEPVFRPGDRVVFQGDSITAGSTYLKPIALYFSLFYPGGDIAFVQNAGVPGDTAPGGFDRMERDILKYNPTVVTICFGMNDGRVAPDPGKKPEDRLIGALDRTIVALKAKNVRVVLLTPGCIDPDTAQRWFPTKELMLGYNDTLKLLADAVKALGERHGLVVADVFAPMLSVTQKGKAEDPKFTIIPDGVHPEETGGAVMGYGALVGMGCAGPVARLSIDAKQPAVTAERCKAEDLRITPDQVSFRRTDQSVPVHFTPAVQQMVKYYPAMQALREYRFAVTGLQPGASWRLTVQSANFPTLGSTHELIPPADPSGKTDHLVGTYTSEQLAGGVDLADAPGPWAKMSDLVAQFMEGQQLALNPAWCSIYEVRGTTMKNWLPASALPAHQKLMAKVDRVLAERLRQWQQLPLAALNTTWTLTRVPAGN
jgi:lysophospholipase L1-like esterase